MKEIGRRYSRKKILGKGLEPIDPEIHHLFHGATDRYKKWAIDYLEKNNIEARKILDSAKENGWTNEGYILREHVSWIKGVDSDSGIFMAARVYELCRAIEICQEQPETSRSGEILNHVFELGRVSMLARVYGIDDEATKKRIEIAKLSNKKYKEKDRIRWQEMYKQDFSRHSKRRAAELIAQREGLGPEAEEAIRRSL